MIDTFTILDVRSITTKLEAHRITNVFRRNSTYMKYRTVYVPFRKEGKVSTIRQSLSVFNIQELLDIYEGRLMDPRYNHIRRSSIKYASILHKLKEHLNQ
jgi:hypothetical protein